MVVQIKVHTDDEPMSYRLETDNIEDEELRNKVVGIAYGFRVQSSERVPVEAGECIHTSNEGEINILEQLRNARVNEHIPEVLIWATT